MKEVKDNLREQAGRQLAQFEAAPPDLMWDRIRSGMHRRRRLAVFRVSLIAATLLLLMGIGYLLINPDRRQGDVIISENRKAFDSVQPAPVTQAGSTEGDVTGEIPVGPGQHVFRVKSAKTPVSALSSPVISLAPETALAVKADAAEPASGIIMQDTSMQGQDIPVASPAGDAIAAKVPSDAEIKSVLTAETIPADRKNESVPESGWILAMHYGTNPAIELTQQDYSIESNRGNYSFDAVSSELAAETSYFDEVESTEHQAPFILGLIISKPFARRWAAESGLVYSRLGYLIRTAEFNSAYREYRNELTYLGVPLGLRFTLIDGRRAGFFTSHSFIFEKGLASRVTSSAYLSGLLNESVTRQESISGFQISSLTGLGGELKFSGAISVYGMAGVQCFFMNKSQPYNIRSARIAWPSFQAGVRVKIR
ncbi:outer membrane beta-barrel protein [Lentimicrobium sp.]|uniref:outer membrane beta-barrel protein n=1 Tax=Lentimicrobium sp. TaxID=2034841 RepID=UPI002C6FA50A|nr:outer membrane beta-barrel protein [Lentimicrobium sp.]HPJ62450.1 outer membrane beta-barrel protein [Lentimicrobium sp.]